VRAREHQKLIAELKNGDEVVTIGGIHGKILDLDEETVSLEVSEKVAIKVSRQAIARRK
jgi:preprotein translocase subunit YajC